MCQPDTEKSKVIAARVRMELIEIDKILTEAKGKCYCEWQSHGYRYNDTCKKCHRDRGRDPLKQNSSPTTNWADYGEVIEWAREQEWWNNFTSRNREMMSPSGWTIPSLDIAIITNPETGSRAIAEFLQTEKDK